MYAIQTRGRSTTIYEKPEEDDFKNNKGLKIALPKPKKYENGDENIEAPSRIELINHIIQDEKTGKFFGLPKDWKISNKQFNVSPKLLRGIKLDKYTHRIPCILIELREKLLSQNGFYQVGIFREAPNFNENNTIKEKIDNDGGLKLNEKIDCNVYANLIKVFLKELPDRLLNCVISELKEIPKTQDDVMEIVNQLIDPNKSIFLWICDLCAEIAVLQKENRMNPQNLAIVIGPNLIKINKIEELQEKIEIVNGFLTKAIIWRMTMLAR